jgi:hypothetical protein
MVGPDYLWSRVRSALMNIDMARKLLELARHADTRFDKLIELFIRRGIAELESRIVMETGRMPADADPC